MNEKTAKWFWRFMIVLGTILMVLGFLTGNIAMWVIAFAIALLVKYNAYDLLFKDLDDRMDRIRRKYQDKEGVH